MTAAIEALAWMLVGHAVADYALQSEFMARAKNHRETIVHGETVWPVVMAAHCAIHAGAVALATGSWALGAAEFAVHFAIDHGKCRGSFGFKADQALHVGCKVLWAAILWVGLS